MGAPLFTCTKTMYWQQIELDQDVVPVMARILASASYTFQSEGNWKYLSSAFQSGVKSESLCVSHHQLYAVLLTS